jgi:hypothetical protein
LRVGAEGGLDQWIAAFPVVEVTVWFLLRHRAQRLAQAVLHISHEEFYVLHDQAGAGFDGGASRSRGGGRLGVDAGLFPLEEPECAATRRQRG